MAELDFDSLEAEFSSAVEVPDENAGDEKPGKTRTTRRSYGPRKATKKQLADNLLNPWAKLATSVAFVAPTVSAVLLQRGEKTVDALVNIAADHPRMMAALTKASKVSDSAEIVETVAVVGLAAAMDLGRIPPDNPVATILGITDLYHQVHPEVKQPTPEPATAVPEQGPEFGATEPPPFMNNGYLNPTVSPLYQ